MWAKEYFDSFELIFSFSFKILPALFIPADSQARPAMCMWCSIGTFPLSSYWWDFWFAVIFADLLFCFGFVHTRTIAHSLKILNNESAPCRSHTSSVLTRIRCFDEIRPRPVSLSAMFYITCLHWRRVLAGVSACMRNCKPLQEHISIRPMHLYINIIRMS